MYKIILIKVISFMEQKISILNFRTNKKTLFKAKFNQSETTNIVGTTFLFFSVTTNKNIEKLISNKILRKYQFYLQQKFSKHL